MSYIREYISTNISGLFKLDKIDLYLRYIPTIGDRVFSPPTLMDNVVIEEFKANRKQVVSYMNGNKHKILFTQDKSSAEYSFDYYITLDYVKI